MPAAPGIGRRVAGGAPVAEGDYAECRRILRRGSRSFSAAFGLLPRELRPAFAAVYAFCRTADDAVDVAGDRGDAAGAPVDAAGDRAASLGRLGRRLERAYAGEPEDAPVDRAFAAVTAACAVPRAVPEALLEGLSWDVEGRRYESMSAVRAYAVRVAGSVGVMLTLLMGDRRPGVLARACDLGVAMQLTNIARDVGEDARAGRLYLPLELLGAHAVDPEELLRAPAPAPGLAAVVAELLEEADRLYARADAGIAALPRRCRAAIGAARLVYAEIGRAVRAAGCDSITGRAATTRGRTLRLLATATLRWRLARRGPGAGDADPPLEEARFLVDAVRGAAPAGERP